MLSTPAPEFALKTPDGKTIALRDLRGKVVLIDYWATWCGPCKMSFPFLQKAYDKDRKDPRVAVFALNRYTFPVLCDDSGGKMLAEIDAQLAMLLGGAAAK